MSATYGNARGLVKARGSQSKLRVGLLLVASLVMACESSTSGEDGHTNVNVAPLASAGPAQNVTAGATVVLDGTGSTDANGDELTFRWAWQSRPAGSSATLAFASSVHPSFIADVGGQYVFQLVVNDGQVDSAPATVTITAAAGNSAPVASVGSNQGVTVGATVSLDGSASSDADGDLITYLWSFQSRPPGSAAVLSSTTAANPSFTADLVGTYVVQLVVNDGHVDSAPATVTIVAAAVNVAPVANAGPDQSVIVSTPVTLNGNGSSDANGDPLSYSWSFTSRPGGSTATLTNPTSVSPTFVPDVTGTYVVQLIVNDGHVDSAPDTVSITANPGNAPPVANAGAAQSARVGDTVTLNGSLSSDANNDPLTYSWSFTSRPAGSTATLTNPTSVNPTFVPDVEGSYVAQLVVNDGQVSSAPATVTITVTINHAPTANAGSAQTVAIGATATLNGSASSDADGDSLTYAWTFASVAPGSALTVLTNPTSVQPSFVPDVAGDYVVRLVVNDGRVDGAPASVTITAAQMTTFKPTFAMFSSYLASATDTGPTTSNNFNAQSSVISVPPISFWNPAAGRLRLYNLDGTKYAINYNGTNLTASNYVVGGTLALPLTTALDRYISVPYTATVNPVTVTVYFTNSGTCTTSQVLIVKADGTIVGVGSACGGTSAAPASTSATFTDAANTEVFIAFSRTTGDSGERFWEVDLTH